MRSYDFHQKIDRENTSSVKWGWNQEIFGEADILPMWIADMDFSPPLEVKNALQERINHGIFGYTYTPSSTPEAIQQWLQKRHNWTIDTHSILYSTGIVPAIATAIQAFTAEGDKIMIQSPVYSPFNEMIKKNHRTVINTPLKLANNRYEIDFGEFERSLKDGVKAFLLCSPHNPGGRVWTKEELQTIGELCIKYDCLILSDEIHSDLVFKPHLHIPIASLNHQLKERTVTFIAPTKTFNIAGLQASAVVIASEELRNAYKSIQDQQGFSNLNMFGISGMEAAYRHGEAWLEELLAYLQESLQIATKFIRENVPGVTVIEPDGTYLLWLDCRAFNLSDEELRERLVKKGKLGLESGAKYGPGGEGFVRMNIACPHETLRDGLNRLKIAFS